jgi:hypothetical protein
MENNAEINAAGKEVYTLLVSKLQTGTNVHVGTLVSAAGRLAGTSLFRSFNYKENQVPPGTVMLSEIANQEWPRLMNILLAMLKVNGLEVDQAKLIVETPQQHKPHKEILEMQTELQKPFNQIMVKHGLDFKEGAFAGAIACAYAILKSHLLVDPQITCGLAALSFVEGCKTVPLPLDPDVTNF